MVHVGYDCRILIFLSITFMNIIDLSHCMRDIKLPKIQRYLELDVIPTENQNLQQISNHIIRKFSRFQDGISKYGIKFVNGYIFYILENLIEYNHYRLPRKVMDDKKIKSAASNIIKNLPLANEQCYKYIERINQITNNKNDFSQCETNNISWFNSLKNSNPINGETFDTYFIRNYYYDRLPVFSHDIMFVYGLNNQFYINHKFDEDLSSKTYEVILLYKFMKKFSDFNNMGERMRQKTIDGYSIQITISRFLLISTLVWMRSLSVESYDVYSTRLKEVVIDVNGTVIPVRSADASFRVDLELRPRCNESEKIFKMFVKSNDLDVNRIKRVNGTRNVRCEAGERNVVDKSIVYWKCSLNVSLGEAFVFHADNPPAAYCTEDVIIFYDIGTIPVASVVKINTPGGIESGGTMLRATGSRLDCVSNVTVSVFVGGVLHTGKCRKFFDSKLHCRLPNFGRAPGFRAGGETRSANVTIDGERFTKDGFRRTGLFRGQYELYPDPVFYDFLADNGTVVINGSRLNRGFEKGELTFRLPDATPIDCLDILSAPNRMLCKIARPEVIDDRTLNEIHVLVGDAFRATVHRTNRTHVPKYIAPEVMEQCKPKYKFVSRYGDYLYWHCVNRHKYDDKLEYLL